MSWANPLISFQLHFQPQIEGYQDTHLLASTRSSVSGAVPESEGFILFAGHLFHRTFHRTIVLSDTYSPTQPQSLHIVVYLV